MLHGSHIPFPSLLSRLIRRSRSRGLIIPQDFSQSHNPPENSRAGSQSPGELSVTRISTAKPPSHFLYPFKLWIEFEVKDLLPLLLTRVALRAGMDFTGCANHRISLCCHFSLSLVGLDWKLWVLFERKIETILIFQPCLYNRVFYLFIYLKLIHHFRSF